MKDCHHTRKESEWVTIRSVKARAIQAKEVSKTLDRATPERAILVRAIPVRATPERAILVREIPDRAVLVREIPVRATPDRPIQVRATPVPDRAVVVRSDLESVAKKLGQ